MQEILTAVTYLIVWFFCSYILKIESGLAKLLISLTAAILVCQCVERGIRTGSGFTKHGSKSHLEICSQRRPIV